MMWNKLSIFFIAILLINSSTSYHYLQLNSKNSMRIPIEFLNVFQVKAFSARVHLVLTLKSENLNYYLEGELDIQPFKKLRLKLLDPMDDFDESLDKQYVFDFLFLAQKGYLYLNLEENGAKYFIIKNYKQIPFLYEKILWIPVPHFVHLLFFKSILLEKPNIILKEEHLKYKKISLIVKNGVKEEVFLLKAKKKYNALKRIFFKEKNEKTFEIHYEKFYQKKNFKIASTIRYSDKKIIMIMILDQVKEKNEFDKEVFKPMDYPKAQKILF